MFANDNNYGRVRDQCHFTSKYRGAAHSTCNLKFNMSNEIPVGFHNGSNYTYFFIMKEVTNEFEFWKNTEKSKKISVPIEIEGTNIDKDGKDVKIVIDFLNMEVSRTL